MPIQTTITLDEAKRKEMLEAFIKKYNGFFQKTLLAMLVGIVPRRYIPDLVFNTGKDCYTDHAHIVLGVDQPICNTMQELYAFVYYVLGHEVQHILSTTKKPWLYGIGTGIKHVISAFQKLYGYPSTNIIGEDNCRAALAKMRKDGHLVPAYEQIAQFCHYICNAVEDGRIERHRTGMYPGYGRYVRLFRGKCWMRNIEEAPLGPVITSEERLSMYCNEVLSLATCHVYGRSFWQYYGGTPEEKTVDEIRRHVTKAVYSRKCKQCMAECITIIDIITPSFVEAFISNPMNQFMQVMQHLIEQIMNAHGNEGFSEMKESKEQDANGNGKNPLGASILGTPTVDENGNVTGEIDDEGDGKETPATEAKGVQDANSSSTPSQDHDDNDNGKNLPDISTLDIPAVDEDRNAANGIDNEGDEAENDAEDDEDDDDNYDDDDDDDDDDYEDDDAEDDENADEATPPTDAENAQDANSNRGSQTGGDVGSHQAGDSQSSSFDMETLEREMQDAIEKIQSDFTASEGNTYSDTAKSMRKNVSDFSSDASAVAKKKDIDFVEVQRRYEVIDQLPFVIAERARILRSKVERIFKPRKTGAYKDKTKGRVSPERLFTLAINEGNCFEIRKKPKEFSGACFVLQDNSGSMGSGRNSKRMFASEATACIEYAFKDFIPLKIVAFDHCGKVIHEVIKNWKDNFRESCAYNFFLHGRGGSCNADYHSITVATEELLARKEKDKILIVLSDGLPCKAPGCKGSPEAAVKAAVDYARARGVKVVGIYIDDVVKEADRKAYESMYGTSCVFTDTDHITDELVNVMTSWAHV